MRIRSEALHRIIPSDALPRFTRECVPTIASPPPNQVVKPTGLFVRHDCGPFGFGERRYMIPDGGCVIL
jgi:hypothetical protein